MSRYSSDSDSSNYHRQGRRKKRSPSASSSDSSRHRKSKSSKHSISYYRKSSKRYRSRNYKRSRSRSKHSSRRSRSASKERHRGSHSRERYRSKHHYKSRMHSNCRSMKYSRSSSSESKNSTSSSDSSKSSSAGIKKNSLEIKKNFSSDFTLNPDEQLREKLLKAIKAAESADHQLKQQGVLPKCVKSRNDISNLAQREAQSEALKDINADMFVPKTFKSSKQGKEKNLDDLNVSSAVDAFHSADTENSVFHTSFFIDPKAKLDWWVKKLHQIRQRAISGEPLNS